MRYGIDQLMPSLLGVKHPDLAVSGINVGPNVAQSIEVSGTVGAATFAARERGIPALAFSGWGNGTGWNEPRPLFSKLYAAAAVKLINHLTAGRRPYLPSDTWLNVNFPHYNSTGCSRVSDVKFVLTKIGHYEPSSSPDNADNTDNDKACGPSQLPTDLAIVLGHGCYASITVGDAVTKKEASPSIQRQVVEKLSGLLTHRPGV
jgi:5'/3'-nucleotidase SurE